MSSRSKRRKLRRQIATDAASVVAPIETPVVPSAPAEVPEPALEVQPEPPEKDSVADMPPDVSRLVETLKAGDVLVDLACGEDEGTLTVFEQCRSIADAAEQAAADYVVALGRFPSADIRCVCYTISGTFGPFEVSVSLVTEATELRGESS